MEDVRERERGSVRPYCSRKGTKKDVDKALNRRVVLNLDAEGALQSLRFLYEW